VASPGKLTGEKVWDKWKAGLKNQLSMLSGDNGAPSSTSSARTKIQKKGRPLPTSLKNLSRSVNSLDRNPLRILNTFTALFNR
jgi:hypothetical protein